MDNGNFDFEKIAAYMAYTTSGAKRILLDTSNQSLQLEPGDVFGVRFPSSGPAASLKTITFGSSLFFGSSIINGTNCSTLRGNRYPWTEESPSQVSYAPAVAFFYSVDSESKLENVFQTVGHENVLLSIGNSMTRKNDTMHICLQQTITGLQLYSPEALPFAESVNFTVSTSHGSNVTYFWDFGDQSNATSLIPWVTHLFNSTVGSKTVTIIAGNDIGMAAAWCSVVIQERITGLHFENTSLLAIENGTTARIRWILFHGSHVDFNLTITYPDGSTEAKNLTNAKQPAAIFFGMYVKNLTQPGWHRIEITATNKVNNETLVGNLSVQRVVYGVVLDSAKMLETNQTFNFTISQYQGEEVRYRLNTMDGKVVITTEKVIPHVYTKAGRYRPTLITSNDISSVVVNCAEIIVQDLIEGLEYTSFNHTVAVRAEAEINWRLTQGSELYIIVDYGDGNSTIVNRSISVGDVFVAISKRNYTKPGEYHVTVNVTNLVDSEEINTTVYVETPGDGAVLAIRRGNLTIAGGDRCTGVLYVAVNDSVTATATVRNGTNVNGFLDFGDNSSERTRYFHREFPDGGWTVHHSYSRAGEYNITVIFSNRNPKNDSHTCRIIVQNPVNKVMITTDSPRKKILETNETFNFTISQHQGDEVRYRLNTMDGKVVNTIEKVIPHVYTKAGRYRPTLITSNDISSVVVNCAEIIVQDLIEGLEYTSFDHTVAVRAEAEINWRLTQGSELYIIVNYGDRNSTIVNRSISVGDVFVAISRHNYTKPGEYHVTVNVTNLVNSEEINTTVYVETPGDGAVLAIKRFNLTIAGRDRCTGVLYVAVNDSVTAIATVRNGTNLNGFLDFGDNSSERTRYFHREFPDGGWTVHHSYSRAGEYNITVIFSNRNPKNDSHTCRIIVQNPVNKVMITTDSPRKKILETNQTFNFTISQHQGDEVRYRLNTMDGKVVNTTEKVIPHVYTKAGRYRPTLITSNDISSVVVNCAEIIVQDLIEGLEYTSFNHTVAVRAEAEINWRLTQGSELYIIVDYGDGNSTIVNRSVSVKDVFVAMSRHNYTKPGEYHVTVNVTNLVDSEEINTTVYVETPGDGAVLAIRRFNLTIAGGDRCTGVLYVAVNDSVTATATVRNGTNVNGFLDFGDNSSERTRYFHREFPDGGWTVHHSYSRAGEYNITVIFSNRNPKNDSHTCRIIVQNPVKKVMITTDSPRKSSESNITFNISFPGSLQPSGHLNYIWRYGVQNFTPEYGVRDNRVENYRYPSKCGVYIATVNVSNEVSFGFAQAEVVIQDEVKDLNWTANYTELSVHDCSPSLSENVFPLDYNVSFNASANGTNVTYTWSFPGNENKTGSSSRHKFVNTGKNNITLTAENAVSRQTVVITLELEQSILNVSIKNDGPSTQNQTVNFTLTAKEFGSDSCFNIFFVDQDEENKYYKSGTGCSGQNATVISNSTRFHHRYDIVGEFDVSLDASNRVSCVKKITTVYVETPVDGAVLAIRRGNLTIAGGDRCTGVLYVAVNDSVTATATVRNGTNVNGFLDFGDNSSERTRYFQREFPDRGWTVHHSYSRAGEYNITVIFSNRNPKNDSHTCRIIVQNPVKDLNWTANYTELSVHDCSPSLPENVFPLDYNVSFNASANGTNVTYTWSFAGNENETGSSSRHKFVNTGKNNITLTAENAVSRQTVVITLELEQSILNVSFKNDGPSTQNQTVNFTLTAKEFGSDSCFIISFVDQDEENKYYKSGTGCSGQNAAVISNPTRFHHRYDIVGEFDVSLDASNRVSCVKKITTVYVETPVDGAVLAIRRGNLTIAGGDRCTGVLYVGVNDSVTATATVRNGTNVNGFLDFGDNSSERTRYFHREFPNGGWTVHHSYSRAGEYNITVTFSNRNPKNDSHTCRIIVQNPVNKVMITTDSPWKKILETNQTFNFTISQHQRDEVRYRLNTMDGKVVNTIEKVIPHVYTKAGRYRPTLITSNDISSVVVNCAEFIVQDLIEGLEYTSFDHTVAVRAEAEINWRLTQGSELYIIVNYGDGNSTIVNRSISVGDVFVAISRHNYTKPGEYHVTVNVTNLVDSEEINTTVYVETPGDGAVLAIRRFNLTIAGGDRCTGVLYVAVNDSVTAIATVRNGTNLNGFLDFGDNSSGRTRYFHREFPDGGWTVHHSYSRAGEYNITVIFSNRNPKNDSHTCRIIVQNPVNKVMITTDSPRKKILETNQTFNFTISQHQGDEVRYRLNTMDGKVVNTTEKVIPHVYTKAGRYRPTLITSNDISSVVVNCAEIIVQDLIEGLEYTSFNHTVAVRAEAEINWRLTQGSELYIIVDYGDGNSTIVNRSVSVGDVFVAMSRHNYTKPGEYHVTVNVTNLVDSEEINTTVYVETPGDGAVLAIRRFNLTIAGGDRCTGVLYVAVNDSVTATATVRNGTNVNGFLDFGDNSSERTRYFHREFPDAGWTVHHSYSRAGEYNITVVFSNRNPKNDSHTCRIIVKNPVKKVMITTDSPRKSSESNITFNISFPGSLQPSGHLNYIWRYGVQNFTPEYEVRDNRVENYRYPSKCGVYIATVNVSNEVSFGFAQAEVVIQDEVKDLNWTANYTELSVHDCSPSLSENVFPLDYNVSFNASANGTNVTYTWSFPGNENKTGSSSRHKFVNTGKNNITLTAENAVSRQTVVITLELEQSILNVSIKNDGPSTQNQTVNFTLTAKEFGSDSCFNIFFVDQDEENKYYKSGTGCSGQNATVISNSTRFHHRYDIVGEFDVSLDASNRVSCVKKITTVYVETPVDGAVLAIRRGNLTIAGGDRCTGVLYVAVNDSVKATATVRNGTNVNGFLDFGDNSSERTRYFQREFPDGGWTVHHSYSRAGEYNITVIFSNRNPKNDSHTCRIIVQNPVKDLNWTANYTELSVHDCSPSLPENVFPLDYNVSFNASANGTNVTYTWSFAGNENETGSSSRHKFVNTGKNNITLTAENAVSRQTVVITLELEQSILNVSFKNDGPSTQNQTVNFTLTAKEFGSYSCFIISFVDQDEENKYYKSGTGCSGQNAAVISNLTRFHHRYDIVGEFDVSLDASNRVSCVKKITTVYVETPVDGAVLAIRRGNLTIAGGDRCTGVLYVAVNDFVTATATVRNGTNVNGFLDFGDNSSERTRYFHREFPNGGWTVHHSYSRAGEYNITVTFYNRNPKNDSHTCRIIVQNPVKDLNWTAKYTELSVHDCSPSLPENVFPLDYNVSFNASANGTNVTYTWSFPGNGKKTGSSSMHKFVDTGKNNITLTAENAVSRQTVVITLELEQSILDVSFKNDGPSTQNQTVNFTLTAREFGNNSCFQISLNQKDKTFSFETGKGCDGQQADKLLRPTHFSYTYYNVGEFDVTLNASNRISCVKKVSKVAVARGVCKFPIIEVPGFDDGGIRKFMRSDKIIIKTNNKLRCFSYERKCEWTFSCEKTPLRLENVNLARPEIIILPRTLNYCSHLEARFLINMTHAPGVYSEKTIVVSVTESPLNAIIDGGSEKTVGNKKPVKISAGESYDPDSAAGKPVDKNCTIAWFCHRKNDNFTLPENFTQLENLILAPVPTPPAINVTGNDSIDLGGCFRSGPGRLNFTKLEITLDATKMKPGTTYNITFVLGKRGRKLAYAHQVIKIEDGDPPILNIK